jgi:hypothetical protein
MTDQNGYDPNEIQFEKVGEVNIVTPPASGNGSMPIEAQAAATGGWQHLTGEQHQQERKPALEALADRLKADQVIREQENRVRKSEVWNENAIVTLDNLRDIPVDLFVNWYQQDTNFAMMADQHMSRDEINDRLGEAAQRFLREEEIPSVTHHIEEQPKVATQPMPQDFRPGEIDISHYVKAQGRFIHFNMRFLNSEISLQEFSKAQGEFIAEQNRILNQLGII